MKDKTFADVYGNNFLENWSLITKVQKPIIAAVNGFAVSALAFPPFHRVLISLVAWWRPRTSPLN